MTVRDDTIACGAELHGGFLLQQHGLRSHASWIVSSLILLLLPTTLYAASKSPTKISPITSDLSIWKLPPLPAPTPKSTQIAELGRQLFFDPRMTGADAISCAQCHVPGLEWSDGRPRPMPQQLTLGRNTIALVNVRFRKIFFWDGRATSLESAIAGHMTENGNLMNEQTGQTIVANISALSGYRRAFTATFHTSKITVHEISKALAAYLRTLVVRDTPFDRWINGDSNAITNEAKEGFNLFTGKAGCVHCHTPPYFSDFQFHNTGMNSIDPGRYDVTGKSKDRSAFRTPDLRQVGRTAPYMHNGSLATLEDVIDFYNKGGDRLDPANELKPLNLSDKEQQELVQFLESLTNENPPDAKFPVLPASDESFIENP